MAYRHVSLIDLSVYIPTFAKIRRTFCGRTDTETGFLLGWLGSSFENGFRKALSKEYFQMCHTLAQNWKLDFLRYKSTDKLSALSNATTNQPTSTSWLYRAVGELHSTIGISLLWDR